MRSLTARGPPALAPMSTRAAPRISSLGRYTRSAGVEFGPDAWVSKRKLVHAVVVGCRRTLGVMAIHPVRLERLTSVSTIDVGGCAGVRRCLAARTSKQCATAICRADVSRVLA